MIAPKLISLLKNPSSKDLAIISIIDGSSWRNRIARIKPTILARKPAKNLLAHFLTQNIWKRAMIIIRPLLSGPVMNILKTLWSILRAVFWQGVVMHLIAQDVILKGNLKRKSVMLAHIMVQNG